MANAKRQKPLLEERECVICKNKFMPTRRNQVVCSDECRYLRHRGCMKAFRDVNMDDLSPRPCVICGQIFTPTKKNQKCCSDICRGNYLIEEGRRRNYERYHYGPNNIEERLARIDAAIARLQTQKEKLLKRRELKIQSHNESEKNYNEPNDAGNQ